MTAPSPFAAASAVSEALAAASNRVGESLVSVSGRRWPITGIAQATDLVLTAAHAAEREDGLRVHAGGSWHPAQLVGRDPGLDLALLRVTGANLTPARWVEAAQRRVMDAALASGVAHGAQGDVGRELAAPRDERADAAAGGAAGSNGSTAASTVPPAGLAATASGVAPSATAAASGACPPGSSDRGTLPSASPPPRGKPSKATRAPTPRKTIMAPATIAPVAPVPARYSRRLPILGCFITCDVPVPVIVNPRAPQRKSTFALSIGRKAGPL